MFTGIITGVGRIVAIHDLGRSLQHGKRLTIEAPAGYLDDVGLGDSIALNGACMTVTTFDPALRQFTIDISAESLDKTSGLDREGPVNLEKALQCFLEQHAASFTDGDGKTELFPSQRCNRRSNIFDSFVQPTPRPINSSAEYLTNCFPRRKQKNAVDSVTACC